MDHSDSGVQPRHRTGFDAAERAGAASSLIAGSAAVAGACRAMAERFVRGGRLLVFGAGGSAADAEHVAVEFVHPVIVGKRALPALALTGDTATITGIAGRGDPAGVFAHQIRLLGSPDDLALGIADDGRGPAVVRGLEVAHEMGMLTVALAGGGGGPLQGSSAVDHCLAVPMTDPLIVKEVQVTAYHILWELVHVFLDHPQVPAP